MHAILKSWPFLQWWSFLLSIGQMRDDFVWWDHFDIAQRTEWKQPKLIGLYVIGNSFNLRKSILAILRLHILQIIIDFNWQRGLTCNNNRLFKSIVPLVDVLQFIGLLKITQNVIQISYICWSTISGWSIFWYQASSKNRRG
jgi:hypothetical protein